MTDPLGICLVVGILLGVVGTLAVGAVLAAMYYLANLLLE